MEYLSERSLHAPFCGDEKPVGPPVDEHRGVLEATVILGCLALTGTL